MTRYLKFIFAFIFALIGIYLGYSVGTWYIGLKVVQGQPSTYKTISLVLFSVLGAIVVGSASVVVSKVLVRIAENMDKLSTTEKLATVLGVILGIVAGTILVLPMPLESDAMRLCVLLLAAMTFGYLGAHIFLSMKEDIFLVWPSSAAVAKAQAEAQVGTGGGKERIKILDTNVIIDGRIADICRTGFVEGPIYVPGCVLVELHHIADSAEQLKRARGRRGLDILNALQKDMNLQVRTYDHLLSPDDSAEVDYRLVQLAKKLEGVIVTNDFNLNKVAELEGVTVLNVNELANALKPVVLPGEEMNVTLIREGKEINQGVAYLEDGTMVVVEGGRRHIGETLDVVVTSVLQTVAGKMIFAEVRGSMNGEDEGANSMRSGSTGSWQRRKGR